jgi:hypothetical protein
MHLINTDFENHPGYLSGGTDSNACGQREETEGMNIELVVKPKAPTDKAWVLLDSIEIEGYPAQRYCYPPQGLIVISSVEVVNDPDDIERGPEYHVSVSKAGYNRCTRNEAKFVLKAFGMTDSEEDNHVPFGKVRNFWMPVADRFKGLVCPCKDSEPLFRENKGDYVWRGITK